MKQNEFFEYNNIVIFNNKHTYLVSDNPELLPKHFLHIYKIISTKYYVENFKSIDIV